MTPLSVSSSVVFNIWQVNDLQLYIAAPIGSLIGMGIGLWIHNKLDTDTVLTALRIFVLIGSIPLTGLGTNSVYGYVLAGVYVILFCTFLLVPIYVKQQMKQKLLEGEAEVPSAPLRESTKAHIALKLLGLPAIDNQTTDSSANQIAGSSANQITNSAPREIEIDEKTNKPIETDKLLNSVINDPNIFERKRGHHAY